eukprot:TRINITY_DN19348_c0_g1_i1.p1 TRINITY_DN19348_c0_g1~~TRINITY_DN19348_c0_g1_i1.p1  ORF type:complete len:632 (+),score=152.93 TRINITY_DN19348_c0_g1_i1:54-1949(+)
MSCPAVVSIAVRCTDLMVFTELGNDPTTVVVKEVLLGDPEGGTELATVGEGEEFTAELVLDARRGLSFSVMSGPDFVGVTIIGMDALMTKSEISQHIHSEGSRSKGIVHLTVQDHKNYLGEAWISAVGFQGQGGYYDPKTTCLCIRKKGVVVARSPESWEELRGELSKFSTGKKASLFKNWKSRWCVMSRGGFSYYEHPGGAPKGEIKFDTTCLSAPFTAIREPNPSMHKEVKDPDTPYFALQVLEGTKPLIILLKAATLGERDRWASFLEGEIEKADSAPSTWPVLRVPSSVLHGSELEVCVCNKEGGGVVASAVVSSLDVLESRRITLSDSLGSIALARVKRKRPSIRDYLQSRHHSIRTVAAVDFTASNGDPNLESSLHYHTSETPSIYMQVLREVLAALQPFSDDSNGVELYGFGAKLEDSSYSACFPLNRSGEECVADYDEAERCYANALQACVLYNPRSMAAVVKTVREKLHKVDRYTVLTIVTAGDPYDVDELVHELVLSADKPMSVVAIGVGTEPFTVLKELNQAHWSSPFISPLSCQNATRPNFRFVRCPQRSTSTLVSHPASLHTPTVHNHTSPQATDLSSALLSIPYHFLDYLRANDIPVTPEPVMEDSATFVNVSVEAE